MSGTLDSSKISLKQVQHVAKLARLSLGESELVRFGAELDSILGYVAQIARANVSADVPSSSPPVANVFRSDTVEPAMPIEKVLQNAPRTDGHFFMVPKVVGGDEQSAGE